MTTYTKWDVGFYYGAGWTAAAWESHGWWSILPGALMWLLAVGIITAGDAVRRKVLRTAKRGA